MRRELCARGFYFARPLDAMAATHGPKASHVRPATTETTPASQTERPTKRTAALISPQKIARPRRSTRRSKSAPLFASGGTLSLALWHRPRPDIGEHVRDIVGFAEVDVLVAEDGVGCVEVEVELGQGPVAGVLVAGHVEGHSVRQI